jgi:small neutral amino acid transporter SnatA (MarC family)
VPRSGAAARSTRLLGISGVNVAARISGVLLAVLAVQFVLDGLKTVGLVRAAHPVPAPPLVD